jgi:glycosyltransferase involved in cell wall biosynthesis
MKIALMVPEMEVGGVEQGAYDLAKGFIERKHEVFVLSAGGKLTKPLEEMGVKNVYFPFHRKNPFHFFKAYLKLKRFIAENNPDIIHARSRIPAWAGYLAVRGFPSTHFVTSIHGFYKKRYYSRILAKGERVIVISNSLKEYAEKFLNIPPSKLTRVSNGVDASNFINMKKENHKNFNIASVGRFTRIKGYQYLLEAAAGLKTDIPDLIVTLIGKGPYKKQLEKKIKDLSLKNVYFKYGKTYKFFPSVDLLVAPHETPEDFAEVEKVWLGRVAVEAQLSGIPVITTMKGLEEKKLLVTGEAVFVPPLDSDTLSRAIKYVYDNYQEVMQQLLQNRYKIQKRYAIDKMVDDTLAVYKELL